MFCIGGYSWRWDPLGSPSSMSWLAWCEGSQCGISRCQCQSSRHHCCRCSISWWAVTYVSPSFRTTRQESHEVQQIHRGHHIKGLRISLCSRIWLRWIAHTFILLIFLVSFLSWILQLLGFVGPKCWRINILGDEAQNFLVGRVVVCIARPFDKSKSGCLNICMYLYLMLLYLYTTTAWCLLFCIIQL